VSGRAVVAGEVVLTTNPVVLVTLIGTEAEPPAFTWKVELVDPMVKVSRVAVTVRLTLAVCVDPVGVIVMAVGPDAAMLACVVRVRVTVAGLVVLLRVTLAGLKVHPTPAGSPEQLPVVVLVAETILFLKLTVPLVPVRVMVRVVVTDCPAETDALGDKAPALKENCAVEVPDQAMARLLASTEPRPVTRL
jgi:hypothetical protein